MTGITTEDTATHDPATAELSALDRRDSCGAQAYVRVTLAAGELLFCAHHASRFREKLQPQAVDWHDESSRLLEDSRA